MALGTTGRLVSISHGSLLFKDDFTGATAVVITSHGLIVASVRKGLAEVVKRMYAF